MILTLNEIIEELEFFCKRKIHLISNDNNFYIFNNFKNGVVYELSGSHEGFEQTIMAVKLEIFLVKSLDF